MDYAWEDYFDSEEGEECAEDAACPVCGALIDEFQDCGCFADLHYGSD
jgi:hypothetical protein